MRSHEVGLKLEVLDAKRYVDLSSGAQKARDRVFTGQPYDRA